MKGASAEYGELPGIVDPPPTGVKQCGPQCAGPKKTAASVGTGAAAWVVLAQRIGMASGPKWLSGLPFPRWQQRLASAWAPALLSASAVAVP